VPVRGAAALAAVLAAHREDARLYRVLATLRTDVPLAEQVGDLRWRGPGPELEPLLRELGAEALRARLPAPAP
jgi:hypothetical protein